MKLINGTLIIENNGEQFLITVGEATKKYSGMIRLNKTAAFIANNLKEAVTKEDILSLMLDKYDVTREAALESIDSVVEKLKTVGLIEE